MPPLQDIILVTAKQLVLIAKAVQEVNSVATVKHIVADTSF